MLVGIVMAGGALVGPGVGDDDGGVLFLLLLQRAGLRVWRAAAESGAALALVRRARGRAMGIAYVGIGVGGAIVPLLAYTLTQEFGWRGALRILGLLMIAVALPAAYFVT